MDATIDAPRLELDDVSVWRDGGCICLKAITAQGDPVELADDEAVALAHALLRLAGHAQ